MQQRHAPVCEGDPRKAMEQGMGDRRSACRTTNDGYARGRLARQHLLHAFQPTRLEDVA